MKSLFQFFHAENFLGIQGANHQFLDEKQANDIANKANQILIDTVVNTAIILMALGGLIIWIKIIYFTIT